MADYSVFAGGFFPVYRSFHARKSSFIDEGDSFEGSILEECAESSFCHVPIIIDILKIHSMKHFIG